MMGAMIARRSSGALDPQRCSQITVAYQFRGASDHGDHPALVGNLLSPTRFQPAGGTRLEAPSTAASRRQWVELAGATAATTPMWTNRSAWLKALRLWANPLAVRELCVQLGCSINAATLLGIATAMADYADHATGRNMAATRATLAARIGCSPRTITTAWRVLQATHWIVLAAPGRGNAQTPSGRRRAAIWHLTPRRAVENFHLPATSNYPCSSPVTNYSPSAHPRPGRNLLRPKHGCRSRRTRPPHLRPIALQRLAAQLVACTHGIDRRGRHIGGVCDAIATSGIDIAAWTAAQLKAALEADMRATGWNWPDQITNPAGFLVSRLRRLPARPPEQPSSDRIQTPSAVEAARRAQSPDTQPSPTQSQPLTDQQHARVAQAQQQCRRALEASRCQRRSAPPKGQAETNTRANSRTSQPRVAVPLGPCSVCGDQAAPQRPYLPSTRAHVCESCWETAGVGGLGIAVGGARGVHGVRTLMDNPGVGR